ncbi:MAG: hypothetical protein KAU50_00405, partial [Candidatus Marinimicrobia bacterium]|nr:hypothetical protein [Candidatus Neomarinimicrobiota bacterium]
FSGSVGELPITHTLEFEQMPGLYIRSNGQHIVKCLPLNQIGIGSSFDEAANQLGDDISEILTDVLGESDFSKSVFSLLEGKSDQVYWEKHSELSKDEIVSETRLKTEIATAVEVHAEGIIDSVLVDEYREFVPAFVT